MSNTALKQLTHLLETVNKKTLPVTMSYQLAEILRQNPEVWRQVSDVNLMAVHQMAKINTDGAPDQVAGMLAAWRGIIAELTPADTTPMERLLIEQVATAWLYLQFVTYKHAAIANGKNTITLVEHWDKHLNAAQRRYLRAVETLARVRKIERTQPLQINIAQQQVNMASS